MLKKVYLAGPMNECDDNETFGWRNEIKFEFNNKFEFIDPTRRDYRFDTRDYNEIVSEDMQDITKSDIIFANSWKPSYGTAMEIMLGSFLRKYIIIVTKSNSPWLKRFADGIFHNMDLAKKHLRSLI